MSQPRRFVIDDSGLAGAVATLTGGEFHHLRDVLRMRAGDEVTIIDGRGQEHHARLREIGRDSATADIIATATRVAPVEIILAAAVIKGPRMDFMVEKAVELGATELWPIVTARTQVRDIRVDRIARWRRLAVAAAKQSEAPGVMMVTEAIMFDRLVDSTIVAGVTALICDAGGIPIRRAIGVTKPSRLILACGPEGGFDSAELAEATRAGFVAVTLGPNRMRSETAAIAALSIAGAALHELDGGD